MDIDVVCTNDLLAIASAYAKATGKSSVTVSKKFHGHTRFFDDLAEGRCSITLGKIQGLIEKFSEEWPHDKAWPRVKILYRPAKRKTLYIMRWESDPGRIYVGITRWLQGRLKFHSRHAKKANTSIVLIGTLRANQHNERSVHRHMEDHAVSEGERGWYVADEFVTAFVQRMLSDGFQWGRCRELQQADLKFYDHPWAGRKKKNSPHVSAD